MVINKDFLVNSGLQVYSNVVIGSYTVTNAAPLNGMIISGNVGIGTSTVNVTNLQIQGETGSRRYWSDIGLNVANPAITFNFTDTSIIDNRIKFVRASSATCYNQQGSLITVSNNTPRLDYDPILNTSLGMLIEESRTNYVLNNTMVGAIVSTPIVSQTITSITYSGSTANVTTSIAHGLSINNIITVSGATPSTYNGTFAVSTALSTSFTYVMLSVPTSNASVVGSYVAITAGSIPSNWAIFATSGLNLAITNIGVYNGINCIDLFLAGYSTNTYFVLSFTGGTAISVSNLQVWTESFWCSLVGGSLTNIVNVYIDNRYSSGPSDISFIPTSTLTRYSSTSTVTTGSTNTYPSLYINFANAAPINATFRIGMPQLELGAFASSVIPTTSASATRAADFATVPLGNWYNPLASTFFVNGQKAISTDAAYGGLIEINDASANNRFVLYVNPNSNTVIFADQYVSNLSDASVTAGSYLLNNPYKVAGSISNATIAVSINGNTPVTGTTSHFPGSVLTTMALGNLAGGSNYMNGWLRKIAYYSSNLSTTTLQAITS